MAKINLDKYSVADMLALYAGILTELQKRKVTRSENNPAGDYAKKLARDTLGLAGLDSSRKGYDAVGQNGEKYQIKGRRLVKTNDLRQLSALRDLEKKPFDYLVGILFDRDFRVMRGCCIPHSIVLVHSTFQEHTNSHIFHLTDDIWDIGGVEDITERLREEQETDDFSD